MIVTLQQLAVTVPRAVRLTYLCDVFTMTHYLAHISSAPLSTPHIHTDTNTNTLTQQLTNTLTQACQTWPQIGSN